MRENTGTLAKMNSANSKIKKNETTERNDRINS